MALKTDIYMYPLINKFRDAFAASFSFADKEGMTLIENVKRHTADGAEVTFMVQNWNVGVPNDWCGVPFDERMVDTIRGSRNTYECYFRKEHTNGSNAYTYTVTCTPIPNEDAPIPPSPAVMNYEGEDEPIAEPLETEDGKKEETPSA